MRSLYTILTAVTVALVMTSVKVQAGCGACGNHGGQSHHKSGQTHAELKAQTTCPVMGGKIDKSQYVDVKGKRIYVCCAGCKKKIQESPDTYIDKLEKAGVKLEQAPEKE